jgi:hypothetical protein
MSPAGRVNSEPEMLALATLVVLFILSTKRVNR